MRKLWVILICLLSVATAQATTYAWGHLTNLTGLDSGGGTFTTGWLVELYYTTDQALPTSIFADLSTDLVANDTPAKSAALAVSGKAGLIYSSSFDTPASVPAGRYVYTVVFNTSGPIVAGTTKWTYFSTSPTSTPGSGNPFGAIVDNGNPNTYATLGTGNGWQTVLPIPEPATFALLGLGLATVWVVRRRAQNSR
jgi:hypothetical protein